MTKQIIDCAECGNEISTSKEDGLVQCRKCGKRTQI